MSLACFIQSQRTNQTMDQIVLQNPQISVQHSIDFMKKMTVVAVSSISFLRNVFPISAFVDRNVEGLPVRILKPSSDVPGSITLINWVKSAFGAVHKHYLKKLMLVFQKQNDGSVLEVYTFSFTYNKEAISCFLQGGSLNQELLMQSTTLPEDIQKSTRQLLRALLTLTVSLQPLPDDCEINMNLEFYDDTPDDFELPEHFVAVDTLNINFPNENCHTLKMGKVDSRFTSIALSTKSVLLSHTENDDQNLSEEDIVMSQNVYEENTIRVVDRSADTQPACVVEDVRDNLITSMSSVNLREVDCICEHNDMSSCTIVCASCSKLQHRACYKLFDIQEVDRHICVNCHEPHNQSKVCTDPYLVGLNDKAGALYRRALGVCNRSYRVSVSTFMTELNYSKQTAQEMFDRLVEDGCLRSSTGKVRTVKKKYLRDNLLSLHFTVNYNINTHPDSDETVILPNKYDDSNRKRKLDLAEEEVDVDIPRKHIRYATIKQNRRQPVNN